MTRMVHLLRLLAVVFAFTVLLSPDAASAQPIACSADARFVRMIGAFPDPGPWQGQQVCLLTGQGMGDPRSTASCPLPSRIATIGGARYCVWFHGGFQAPSLVAATMWDESPSIAPPDAVFPTPANPQELVDNLHCTNADPAHFVRTLGKWRGVTLCQWSGPSAGDPVSEAGCDERRSPYQRIRRFGVDFGVSPPPSSTPPPYGTRFCITNSGHRWEARGFGARIMAVQTRICVTKYRDGNGNNVWDHGEPPIGSVSFRLISPFAPQQGVTDPAGQVCFAVPRGGTYLVEEVMGTGMVNTDPGGPAPIWKGVAVQTGQTAQVVFGNR